MDSKSGSHKGTGPGRATVTLASYLSGPDDVLALENAHKHILGNMGYHDMTIDVKDVPADLRYLAELAAFFGVNDDRIRDEAIALMSKEFLQRVRADIDATRPILIEWLSEIRDWSDAKTAYCALAEAFPVEYDPSLFSLQDHSEEPPDLDGLLREFEKEKAQKK